MDAHYQHTKKVIAEYLDVNRLCLEEMDSTHSIAFTPDLAVCDLSDDRDLPVTDLKRKYYLICHEFEEVIDLLPNWIPIPLTPPTNTEAIIWFRSVLDVMPQIERAVECVGC